MFMVQAVTATNLSNLLTSLIMICNNHEPAKRHYEIGIFFNYPVDFSVTVLKC